MCGAQRAHDPELANDRAWRGGQKCDADPHGLGNCCPRMQLWRVGPIREWPGQVAKSLGRYSNELDATNVLGY